MNNVFKFVCFSFHQHSTMFSMCKRGLNVMFDDKRVTITVLSIWFVMVAVLFSYLGLFSTTYMAVGPSKSLTYLGIVLDTWPKYNAVLIFVIISTAINDLAGDAISPWYLATITDHKSRIIPYSKGTCLIITQIWSAYVGIMSIASISLVFSQFDLLAVRLIVDLIVNQYTTMRFLRNKTHSAEEYNRFFEEKNEGDIDLEMNEEKQQNTLRVLAHKNNSELLVVHKPIIATAVDEKESLLNVV